MVDTFQEIALKQSLTEHILWIVCYLILTIVFSYLITKHTKNKEWGLVVASSIFIVFNIFGMIGHLASLKYVL